MSRDQFENAIAEAAKLHRGLRALEAAATEWHDARKRMVADGNLANCDAYDTATDKLYALLDSRSK